MARFGRERLASLSGEEWLQWLAKTDPNGFNWQEEGKILLSLPYAPEGIMVDDEVLGCLIEATLNFVSQSGKKMREEPDV